MYGNKSAGDADGVAGRSGVGAVGVLLKVSNLVQRKAIRVKERRALVRQNFSKQFRRHWLRRNLLPSLLC